MKTNSKLVAVLLLGSLILVGCTNQSAGNNNTQSSSNSSSSNSSSSNEGATQKPSSWPSTVPTIAGAFNYNYAKAADTYYLGYEIRSTESVETITNKVDSELRAIGWVSQSDSSVDTLQGSLRGYEKEGYAITMAVSVNEAGDIHTVAIIMGPQTTSD